MGKGYEMIQRCHELPPHEKEDVDNIIREIRVMLINLETEMKMLIVPEHESNLCEICDTIKFNSEYINKIFKKIEDKREFFRKLDKKLRDDRKKLRDSRKKNNNKNK